MLLIWVYLLLVCLFSLTWLMYRWLKNPSVVDGVWSIAILIAGLVYLFPFNLRTSFIALLLTIWAFRLGGYIWWTRISKSEVDKRYIGLSKQWKMSAALGFFLNFQLQALLAWILASVFYFTSTPDFTYLDIVATFGVIAGIIGESIADYQLYNFKIRHKGSICNTGLWHYSRHPNYFCEWLIWLGFSLFALSEPYGYIALSAPIMLYLLFTRVTGPITENASIKSHGKVYRAYQRRTPMFFPWNKS